MEVFETNKRKPTVEINIEIEKTFSQSQPTQNSIFSSSKARRHVFQMQNFARAQRNSLEKWKNKNKRHLRLTAEAGGERIQRLQRLEVLLPGVPWLR